MRVIMRNPLVLMACIGLCFHGSSGLALPAPNDLLFHEQWALNNDSQSFAVEGTCSVKPDIENDQYSCSQRITDSIPDYDINAPEAWEYLSTQPDLQQEVVIGLIDTGIDYLHPDLINHIWMNPGEATGEDLNQNGIDDGCEDGIDNDQNQYLDDCHGISTLVPRFLDSAQTQLNPAAGDPLDNQAGHGTNMAGIIAAQVNNRTNQYHGGIAGVAGLDPNIKILTCAAARIVSDAYVAVPNQPALYGEHDAILACLNYMIEMKDRGVNLVVINGSGGASEWANLGWLVATVNSKYQLNTPQIATAIDQLHQRDVTLVLAAGNHRWDLDSKSGRAYYPAAFDMDNIISVGAISATGKLADFSSYGRASVDLLAPGEKILSTNPGFSITRNEQYSDFVVSDGTSQATAFVSGAVALLKTHQPTQALSPAQIRRLLISSGKHLPETADKIYSATLLRLWDTDGRGALTCSEQVFQRRQTPWQNSIHKLPGEEIIVEIERINCAQPADEPSLQVHESTTGSTITLYDDGLDSDRIAGDGIYTARWTIPSHQDQLLIHTGIDSATGQEDILEIITTVRVDNTDSNTQRSGTWWPSIYRSGYYGTNYRVAYSSSTERWFSWLPVVSRSGYYEVMARWPVYQGFSTQASFTIRHQDSATGADAVTEVLADQSRNGGQWNSLGVFWFDEGEQMITLSNRNSDRTVVADAIQLRWHAPE